MTLIIGFSRAKSPLKIGSTAIELAEKTDFSHVFMRAPDTDTDLMMVYQASHGYVNSMTYDNFKVDNIVAKEYTLTVPPQQYKDLLIFMKSSLGTPYGYLEILMISIKKLFHIEINVRDGMTTEICSEFGARVAKLDGINVGNDLDYETPSDLDHVLTNNNIPCNILNA